MSLSQPGNQVVRTRAGLPARTWVLAAHPDDETIGLGATLSASPGSGVLHLTRGAPADRRWWPAQAPSSREAYAALRRAEAEAALGLAGIPRERIVSLGAEDLESISAAADLAEEVAQWLVRARCAVLVTQPYEGGHPDHDTAALVAHLARLLIWRAGVRPPRLLEMSAYHSCRGRLRAGTFLHRRRGAITERAPSQEEAATKRRMFDAYASQRETLAQFPIGPERLRAAPPYRFDLAPHAGPLWYEAQGWMEGGGWRARALRALEAHGVGAGACL